MHLGGYGLFYEVSRSVPHKEATTVAEALLQNWISKYGMSLQIHVHQGTNFVSVPFKGLCKVLQY